MPIENSNLDIHTLILVRPADSVCTVLASALNLWKCTFSVCYTRYEVLRILKEFPVGQRSILVVRPEMLGFEVALFIKRFFPTLTLIGWIDPGENISNCTITQLVLNGMIVVSCLDELRQAIDNSFGKTAFQAQNDIGAAEKCFSQKVIDKMEYELSNDEVNALLGVE